MNQKSHEGGEVFCPKCQEWDRTCPQCWIGNAANKRALIKMGWTPPHLPLKLDFQSWFYKNCKNQRKREAKICTDCPFRNYIEFQESLNKRKKN
jgi:hypothetical protein